MLYTLQQKLERKDTNRPAQSTKTCHTPLSTIVSSHHNPLLRGPSTVREGFSCCDNKPLNGITQLPGLTRFLTQHVQGHVTAHCHLCQLAILLEKRDVVTRPIQPDNVQRILAHVAFTRCGGGHIFVFRSSFAFTLPHWALRAADFHSSHQGRDIPLNFFFLPPLRVRQ